MFDDTLEPNWRFPSHVWLFERMKMTLQPLFRLSSRSLIFRFYAHLKEGLGCSTAIKKKQYLYIDCIHIYIYIYQNKIVSWLYLYSIGRFVIIDCVCVSHSLVPINGINTRTHFLPLNTPSTHSEIQWLHPIRHTPAILWNWRYGIIFRQSQ